MTGAVDETYSLLTAGRFDEALSLIEPVGSRPDASHGELAAYAETLKIHRRFDEALEVYRRAVQIAPTSGVAEHNLAALLGDRGRYPEAEAAARRAFAKGLDAPETWAVLARALQGQDRYEEAAQAYTEALRRRPTMPDVHRDLAQMIWMKTEDVDAATMALRRTARDFPADPAVAVQLAKALQAGGREEAAYDVLLGALARAPVWELEVAASDVAAALKETVAALRHAESAMAIVPDEPRAILAVADAQLAMGRAGPAARLTEALHARLPDLQQVIARMGAAWRMMGDPRYHQLYDYDAFVRGWTIDTPPGWSDLPSYLKDLAASLRALHKAKGHPYDQSVRFGSQTQSDLVHLEDPAIRAFFTAIDRPIRRHMEAIGQGEGPLRRRNTGRYRVQGAWSVRLRPGGFHVDHVHPLGWLSSACHIELPAAVKGEGHEGWLKFGEPGIATQPVLPAERFEKPVPGRLVLFPSYMWHGTVPFTGDDDRLSVAFDVEPA